MESFEQLGGEDIMAIICSVVAVTTGVPEVGFGTQLWAVILTFALVLLLTVVPVVVVVV